MPLQAATAAEGEVPEGEAEEREAQAARAVPPQQQAWADVVSAGLSFLEKLGQALPKEGGGAEKSLGQGVLSALVAQDPATGQKYLRLPMPNPDVLQKVADLFNALAGRR
jgi:hypothetical protein